MLPIFPKRIFAPLVFSTVRFGKNSGSKRIRRLLVLLISGLLLLGWAKAIGQPSTDEWVRVAGAQSGQSLEVSSAQSPLAESVRLLGIDAPDARQQPWGPEAAQHLDQWLRGKRVRLEFDQPPQDAYGRKHAYVWLDDALINEKLVAEGWALAQGAFAMGQATRSTRYDQRFLNAQEQARLLHRGLWSVDHPLRQTPAEFRQEQG